MLRNKRIPKAHKIEAQKFFWLLNNKHENNLKN